MLYEYRCTECGAVTDARNSVENRHDAPECPVCQGTTRLKITGGTGFTAVMGGADNPGYMCPVTEQWVDSKRQRKRIMEENDLYEKA